VLARRKFRGLAVGGALGIVRIGEPAMLGGLLGMAGLLEQVRELSVGVGGPVVCLGRLCERGDGAFNGL